jgi:mono/diheme cytochrome c family protein
LQSRNCDNTLLRAGKVMSDLPLASSLFILVLSLLPYITTGVPMTNLFRVLVATTSVAVLVSLGFADEKAPVQFNRDIRPILFDNCFSCHGPDANSRAADLRLDDRQWAIDAGAITPGKPEESELVARLLTTDDELIMPPPKSHKKLTDEQKQLLIEWVKSGAEYQPHWSFIAPQSVQPPPVQNQSWVRGPIDQFIMARLESEKLQPAPEADLRTLARRAALDITGLPPSPQQVHELLNDPSERAYEHYVDRLLESDRWGEHRARYWLDYARYADTHGIHFDNYREMWSYRDWVINAFNKNLPYDQFTLEQLAGDLLPNATLDQRVATGFNRCNITTNEGGIIDEEYAVLYARDRTETTSQVYLGLSAGCAVCHDHKFDPITMRDFYSMAAFFNNTTQNVRDGNIKDTPPIMQVPMSQDRELVTRLKEEIATLETRQAELREQSQAPFAEWLKQPANTAQLSWNSTPSDGLVLQMPLDEGANEFIHAVAAGAPQRVAIPASTIWAEGHLARQAWVNGDANRLQLPDIGDFDTNDAFSFGAWLFVPPNANGAVFARMNEAAEFRGWDLWLQNGQIGSHIISAWPKDALKGVTAQKLPENKWVHVLVTYDGSAKPEGLKVYVNGNDQPLTYEAKSLTGSIRSEVPFSLGQRHSTSPSNGVRVQDLRIYSRLLAKAELDALRTKPRLAYLIAKQTPRSEAEQQELFDWYLQNQNQDYQQNAMQLANSQKELAAAIARGTIAHVMQEKTDAKPMAYILFRGEYDKRRDPVEATTPGFLPPMPEDLPRNRLGLAKWLLAPENPLTARVTVNRFWQEIFGTGLVSTSGDFGIAGQLPSHPELLDWLAVEFRENGWDVKELFRWILTSSTYRQSALTTQEKLERDPHNRWLSRGPRFRLEAEMIRDYALATSGLLSEKLGGPSVKPYQPEGVWEAVAMIGSNTRDYKADSGENLYRRSMYTFWKRSAPPASMEIFNAPSREVCTIKRERTNTPLQALVTLNDPQFVEAAKNLASSILQSTANESTETDASRIQAIAERLISRPFTDSELDIVQQSLNKLRESYLAHPEEALQLLAVGETKVSTEQSPELAAWTMLVNELMNLDEALNK